ncbi:MAG TPA: NfeD family protein [Blastocatellia bacterium]|nr:NfeD family protein [Blastocatellia bacterium]
MKLLDYRVIIAVALLLLIMITILGPRAGMILLGLVPVLLLIVFLLRMALRSHRDRVTTGEAGMIGMTGRADSELSPDGMVFIRGELWRARARIRIAAGESVRVVGVDGLTLEVEHADKDKAMMNRRASFLDQSSI